MTRAGENHCPTAQTVQESENEQAVPSTPGGQEGNARQLCKGQPCLGIRWKNAALPWPVRDCKDIGQKQMKRQFLPNSCQVTGMEKHLHYSGTQLDFKTGSGGKELGLNSASLEAT